MELGSKLVVATVAQIAKGTIETIKQPSTEEKEAPKIFKETCRINWQASLKNINNTIRGLSPYPAAWTLLQNGDDSIELKIYRASKQKETHEYPIGTVITTKKEMKIAAKKGFVIITELQLAGKKKMPTQDLLNGFNFHENAKVL